MRERERDRDMLSYGAHTDRLFSACAETGLRKAQPDGPTTLLLKSRGEQYETGGAPRLSKGSPFLLHIKVGPM